MGGQSPNYKSLFLSCHHAEVQSQFTEKMERFNQFLMQKKDFESQNFAIFDKVGHNFGKSDEDMIY